MELVLQYNANLTELDLSRCGRLQYCKWQHVHSMALVCIFPSDTAAVLCCMYSNNLTDLPEDLSGLQHVRTLRIKYNQLSRVPAAVIRLPQLTTLELSGNQIVKLDSAVAKVRIDWQRQPACV